MRKALISLTIISAALLIWPSALLGQTYTGMVVVDTVQGKAGDHIAVPVRLTNNNVNVSGIVVPLRYSSDDLSVDSVSFVGSFLTSAFTGAYLVVPESNFVQIAYIPNVTFPIPTILSPNGLIATIFFSLSPTTSAGMITIDSVNQVISLGDDYYFYTNIVISDPSGLTSYFPGFVEGAIEVLTPTDVADDHGAVPSKFELGQNYPNPFNPSTTIEFSLPSGSQVKLQIFNVLGQVVETLVDEYLSAGTHQINFDASDQPSGVYFYRLSHSGGIDTKKMVLVK